MACEPGVDDPRHLRMLLEPRGDVHRVAAMAFHAHGEGLDAAQGEEGIERARHAAHRILQEGQALAQLGLLSKYRRAADDVRVAVEILRRGMHHDVEAVLERALDPRRSEGVIAYRDQLVLARHGGNGLEINDLEERVGRGLDPDHAAVGFDRFFERTGFGQVNEARAQIGGTLTHALQDAVAAAVEIVHRHDMGARVEELEHGADRRHAGGEGEAGLAALELGDAGFERIARRVARARVVVALVLARARLRVGRGGVDRRHHRAGPRVGLLAGVDHLGLELHSCFLRLSQLRRSMRVIRPRNSSPSTTIATSPRLKISISCSIVAFGGTVTRWLSMAAVTGSRKCAGFSYTSSRMSSSSTMPTILLPLSTGSCDTS